MLLCTNAVNTEASVIDQLLLLTVPTEFQYARPYTVSPKIPAGTQTEWRPLFRTGTATRDLFMLVRGRLRVW